MTAFQLRPPLPSLQSGFAWSSRICRLATSSRTSGSRARVSEVLSGARALSIDMIRALNQGLGIPAEILIRSDPVTQGKVANELSVPAARRLQAWGLMGAVETFDAFITRSLGGMPATAMLRKTRTERTNAKTNIVALQAWCAAALLRSQSVPVTGRFDKKRINLDLVRNLAKLSARDDGPQTVVHRARRALGSRLSFYLTCRAPISTAPPYSDPMVFR